jgi:hypothetical protein
LADAAGRIQPVVNLPAYSARFRGSGPYPFEEFFLLAYLLVESGQKFSDADKRVIEQVVIRLALTEANYDELMVRGHVKDKGVSSALKPALLP